MPYKNFKGLLKKIEGHVREVNCRIGNEMDYADVMNEIATIKSVLDEVETILLEGHIRQCLVDTALRGETSMIDDLLVTIERRLK